MKLYLIEFRNRGIFYEQVTNQILDDLVAACEPRRMTVVGAFSARGGLHHSGHRTTYRQAVGPNPAPRDATSHEDVGEKDDN